MYPVVQLKAGREASVGFHHPWVFSGAIEKRPPNLQPGTLVQVTDRNGQVLGVGTYGPGTIAVRVFDFSAVEIGEKWILAALTYALKRRELLGYGANTQTTGYRLVHGEGDNLPGLVVDVFGSVVVMQISTAGMDALRPLVIAALQHLLQPMALVEKSDMGVREQEALPEVVKVQAGELPKTVSFLEHGNAYKVDVLGGQKTGFFLDQKGLRNILTKFAAGRTALNLFSYTGASSVALLKAGAIHVHNVDESQPALDMIAAQLELNGLAAYMATTEQTDIFQWLGKERPETYDMVLLDPPALAKTKREVELAMKAYHFLNRAAMRLAKDGGIFVTSSCSHYVSEDDLMFTLRRASVQAGVKLHLLSSVRQSADHPWSVYWPEGQYLKSFIFQVQK
ncbi:MAG: class I SAM-dependent rRNA methyltransferase [Candidatus Andersenbacteria bacterium]|nr:class I SAM-dependent rRNA methyltransferase [Candidatus Andersenbacteria bacterium]